MCECECGAKINVRADNLRTGQTTSCGCKRSKAQRYINELLARNNVPFQVEYSFENLIGVKKGTLRFDWAIFNQDGTLSHLVEFDGRQHFEEVDFFNSTTVQKHDKIKNKYCLDNGIELRRFRGNYEELTIEDLVSIK